MNSNIPSLGDEKTPYEQVKKFYEFWYSFKSWREFNFQDEFDLQEAESRFFFSSYQRLCKQLFDCHIKGRKEVDGKAKRKRKKEKEEGGSDENF